MGDPILAIVDSEGRELCAIMGFDWNSDEAEAIRVSLNNTYNAGWNERDSYAGSTGVAVSWGEAEDGQRYRDEHGRLRLRLPGPPEGIPRKSGEGAA